MWYGIFLLAHLLCVALWLGGAVYERFFIVGNIAKLRGTGQELSLVRLMLSSEPFFMTATLVLLGSGIGMTLLSGAGFFQPTWLGVKQTVMVLGFIGFGAYIAPRMKSIRREIEGKTELTTEQSEQLYRKIMRMTYGFDLVHLAVVFNVILAVWRPE